MVSIVIRPSMLLKVPKVVIIEVEVKVVHELIVIKAESFKVTESTEITHFDSKGLPLIESMTTVRTMLEVVRFRITSVHVVLLSLLCVR